MNERPAMYRRSRIPPSVFCLLLILSGTLHVTVSETFTIVPSTADDASCPDDSQCFTLSQYASNSSLSSNLSNITLELQPGTHSLDSPLTVRDISSFTMSGTNATLLCVKTFNVYAIEYVYLGGISFVNCHSGGRSSIYDVGNFTLENSTFQTDEPFHIQYARNILIANSRFTSSPRGVFSILRSLILHIRNCVFSDNIQASTSSIGVIVFDGRRSIIENSIFKNNRMNEDQVSGSFLGSGQSLTITNCTFANNSGGRLGGEAVTSRYQSVVISGSSFRDNVGVKSAGAVNIGPRNISEAVTVLIVQSVFINNTATGGSFLGGAVYVSANNSSITIRQGIFVDNNGTHGGALGFVIHNSYILVDQSTFIGNTAHNSADGGAVKGLGFNVSFVVKQSTFTRNKIEGSGGVLSLLGYFPIISINQSNFTKNTASDSGGVIHVFYRRGDAKLEISNSVFSNNSARRCGVLRVYSTTKPHGQNVQVKKSVFTSNIQTTSTFGSNVMCLAYTDALIVHSNFSHNSGSGDAGALFMEHGMLAVEGSIFDNNRAGRDGGVIYGRSNFIGIFNQTVFTNNHAVDSGGVMYLTDSQVTIFDSTIGFNQAKRGGAIAIFRGSLEIKNSNVFNNTAEVGSVISANGAKVNVPDHFLVSVDPTMTTANYTSEEMRNDAVSYYGKLSVLSSSIFIVTSISYLILI